MENTNFKCGATTSWNDFKAKYPAAKWNDWKGAKAAAKKNVGKSAAHKAAVTRNWDLNKTYITA